MMTEEEICQRLAQSIEEEIHDCGCAIIELLGETPLGKLSMEVGVAVLSGRPIKVIASAEMRVPPALERIADVIRVADGSDESRALGYEMIVMAQIDSAENGHG